MHRVALGSKGYDRLRLPDLPVIDFIDEKPISSLFLCRRKVYVGGFASKKRYSSIFSRFQLHFGSKIKDGWSE